MNAPLTPIQSIDALRIAKGFSQEQLASAAGITQRRYRALVDGEGGVVPRAATLARLRAAMGRLAGRPSDLATPYLRVVFYIYCAALGIVCQREGVDTAEVHAQDPARKATADPAWQRAAHLRRMAVYLVNTALGVSQTDLARAIGLTPAAISLACKAGENRLDEPGFALAMAELTRVISGGEFG